MATGDGKSVIIVGAGLAGSLLACYLAKLGYAVTMFDRRGDPREAGYAGGRSINLALSARGLWGLEGIGLSKAVLEHAIPMKGRAIHSVTMPPTGGEPGFQPYSSNPSDAINSISRGGLNVALLDAAEAHENVAIRFNARCLDVDPDLCEATFQMESGGVMGEGPIEKAAADLVIGADGAFSPVRARMQKTDRFEYSQTYLAHGYKELHIPAVEGGKWGGYALDPNALHIWPRGGSMMIALPNPDKSFTCTLFWPFDGEHSFANLRTPAEVESFFRAQYPNVPPLMPTLVEDYLKNPVSSLVTVRCWPWVHLAAGGKGVVLAGDAAHAIVPFFGQGMNAAFEDVRVLSECLERLGPDGVHSALNEYQRLRKPQADAIARMAIDNFEEMRDKVGSKVFVYRKKIEHLLNDVFPEWLKPKYNLVSFTIVPYAQAQARGARIDRVFRVLVLIAAVLLSSFVLAMGLSAWFMIVGLLVLACWIWDWYQYRKDTAV